MSDEVKANIAGYREEVSDLVTEIVSQKDIDEKGLEKGLRK